MRYFSFAYHFVRCSTLILPDYYASCAWSGFVTATDRKRVDACLWRSKRNRFCSPDLVSYDDLAEADTRLFSRISANSLRVLYDLLPPPSTAWQHYSLPERSHHYSLPYRTTYLANSNFITRCLLNDAY